MRPEAGARCTCTFQIERKMLMRWPITESSISSTISTTRPSAGEIMMLGVGGITRCGSRKKKKTKRPRKIRMAPEILHPGMKHSAPAMSGGRANRYASLIMDLGEILCSREDAARTGAMTRIIAIQMNDEG